MAVQGLFDRSDVSIDFAPEGITMLYGSNGAGKSTVLRILRAALAADNDGLLQEPFRELSLTFAGGLGYTVNRTTGAWEERAGRRVSATGSMRDERPDLLNPEFRAFLAERVGPEQSHLLDEASSDGRLLTSMFGLWRKRTQRQSRHDESRRFLPRPAQLLTSGRALHSTTAQSNSTSTNDVEALERAVQRSREALEVARMRWRNARAQGRLDSPAVSDPPCSLDEVASELQQKLQSAVAEAQERARALDSTFGRRVIERVSNPEECSMEELRRLRSSAETLHARLARCGLLAAEMSLPPEHAVSDARMDAFMQLYLADMFTKALTLVPLLKRVEALKEIVDSHFVDKHLLISAEKGLVVRLTHGARDQTLGLSKLSSGEQQILMLFYSLLFRSERGSVFMIDEPEISLNVLWQEKFIGNLTKVGKVVPMQFILATHSPQIVGAHQHLLRQVGGS
jgi:predicted ATPase